MKKEYYVLIALSVTMMFGLPINFERYNVLDSTVFSEPVNVLLYFNPSSSYTCEWNFFPSCQCIDNLYWYNQIDWEVIYEKYI